MLESEGDLGARPFILGILLTRLGQPDDFQTLPVTLFRVLSYQGLSLQQTESQEVAMSRQTMALSTNGLLLSTHLFLETCLSCLPAE
jgi:hypothetical protein